MKKNYKPIGDRYILKEHKFDPIKKVGSVFIKHDSKTSWWEVVEVPTLIPSHNSSSKSLSEKSNACASCKDNQKNINLKKGDIVLINNYSGSSFRDIDDEEFTVIKSSDIILKIE